MLLADALWRLFRLFLPVISAQRMPHGFAQHAAPYVPHLLRGELAKLLDCGDVAIVQTLFHRMANAYYISQIHTVQGIGQIFLQQDG